MCDCRHADQGLTGSRTQHGPRGMWACVPAGREAAGCPKLHLQYCAAPSPPLLQGQGQGQGLPTMQGLPTGRLELSEHCPEMP